MPRVHYIGNYDFLASGKFLLEILAQLRNFGVGRLVTKGEWLRKWPEVPSYCIVKKVEPEMDRWLWKGSVWAEWVYRGTNLGIHEIGKELDRSDWKLIHKHEEKNYLDKKDVPALEYRIPSHIPLPPLQRLMWENEQAKSDKESDGDDIPMIPTVPYIDEEHEMLRKYIRFVPELNAEPSKSVYDGTYDSYLDLYGKELPIKVDEWDN